MENPQGLWIGVEDEADNCSKIKTKSRKIELYIEEMEEWIKEIEPELEEKELSKNDKYPFILMAGRHIPENANTLMRKPDWNKGRRACTLALNPEDAKNLNIEDKEIVRISTEAGSAEIEAEITDDTRRGQVIIPHGFGLKYKGKEHGVNVNRLTKNTHRDRLAATPLHRFVRASIEKI
jgi:anaerobic selenocysteine-containing dehydrogenase